MLDVTTDGVLVGVDLVELACKREDELSIPGTETDKVVALEDLVAVGMLKIEVDE